MTKDWITGVVFAVIYATLAFGVARAPFYDLETAAYDSAMRLNPAPPEGQIAIIEIDDTSIDNIGRWPWSRDILADFIHRLDAGGAQVVASAIFFSEPQIDVGLERLKDIETFVTGTEFAGGSPTGPVKRDLDALASLLSSAIEELSYDERLARAVEEAGNVLLPLDFKLGAPLGNPDRPLPGILIEKGLLANVAPDDSGIGAVKAQALTPPIDTLSEAAAGLGHLNQILDQDGVVRFQPLVLDYYGAMFPSLSLVIAARRLNLDLNDIEVLPGRGVRLKNLTIDTTPDLRMYNHFFADRDGRPAFSTDSFYDVFTGLVPVDKFRNRIVLIGANAAGAGDNLATPVSAAMAPVHILAHTVSSILSQHSITRPGWGGWAELLILVLLAGYLALVLPRMRAGVAALFSFSLIAILIMVEFGLLLNKSLWLQLMVPAMFVLTGHLVITVKRFWVTERQKLDSDAEGAESNRMLGLAFQGQGQLDMAFEKFRKCPLNQSMLDVLYALALDFESKRQFNKAGAVYSYMSEFDSNFRDLKSRLKRNQSLEETMIIGAHGHGNRSTLLLSGDDEVQKPTLGRYRIEREIGKGAMGTVYLGRDPKINRVVAIKTIALSEEFDEEELSGAKERFFREAETAGRLNHPDIVTVYDAGEELDLAYIAMEFLKGTHLNDWVRSPNLLPPQRVFELMARTADALDYAHRQGVIHRDIKPANIMYDADSNDMKITDFGIARITSSSKTKTGIVLGTPSYMSPEQLAGKNVTGRSDLFSLGVTLYQLLAGQLPFRADSMATLMYMIANEPYTPLAAVCPTLPECLESVVARALAKDVEQRYQNGLEMAHDIRECSRNLDQ